MKYFLRGVTLPEILVVVTIIAILVATLTIVLRPIIVQKSQESTVRSDLRQNITALNLYMSDYDGNLPAYLSDLAGGYKYVKGRPELANYPGALGAPEYFLAYNYGVRVTEKRRSLTSKFDQSRNAVVKANFFPRSLGFQTKRYFSNPRQGFVNSISKTEAFEVLGGFLDGHVRWVPMLEEWEEEAAFYAMGAIKEEMDERQRVRKGR